MRVERRFTKAAQSPYADIPFREALSEIRNPDGSVVFHMDGIEVPEAWSQVACDVLAQKYFRRAGVPTRLQRVEENDVPSWLWRCIPDEKALEILAAGRAFRLRAFRKAGLRPACGRLDLLGLEGGLFLHRRGCASLLRRDALHAGPADGRAEFPAMVQHRPALGLWHRRAEPGSFLRGLQDGPLDQVEIGL